MFGSKKKINNWWINAGKLNISWSFYVFTQRERDFCNIRILTYIYILIYIYYKAINVLDKNWHNSFTLFIGFENRAWLINHAGYLIDSDRNCSFISGVTILGTPAEIYNFGTQYWITIISIFFSGVVVATVYLPVFTTLQLNSVYEVRSV